MGLGTLVLLADVALIWVYTLSCHSCRHIVGGRLRTFSRHPVRYRLWTAVSKMNAHHMALAWASLVSVALADFYVGPTCHYVMGGVEVDPDTAAATGVPGLFAAGEVAGGMHGSNRLGGNSLSDLLVFGRRAGLYAAEYAAARSGRRPAVSAEQIEGAVAEALRPFGAEGGDPGASQAPAQNPYILHRELQQTMNDLVGIIRPADEMNEALQRLGQLRARAWRTEVEGHRRFNPDWHVALDLCNMLLVSECVARSALERTESRGGHTRDDFPEMDRRWRGTNLACELIDPSGTREPMASRRARSRWSIAGRRRSARICSPCSTRPSYWST